MIIDEQARLVSRRRKYSTDTKNKYLKLNNESFSNAVKLLAKFAYYWKKP